MEKIHDLSDVECTSSTKIGSNYSSGSTTKSSHYGKSNAHGRGAHHHHHDSNSFGNGRQNQVSNVLLFGIPIVALIMDGKERLCLAQISSTLLKDFSYNEIHNRRVALGINCIQCTPVQLEILRRAGAMPVTSRRCGMITKREAERLCQSFLGDHAPPQLPENFAFDVFHECAWGCRGSFVPSRYNSSRAKCIRCTFCQLFFSPNKFIFHSHRLPTSRYVQPDAANFNSWRRHLKLCSTNSTSSTTTTAAGSCNNANAKGLDTKTEHLIGSSLASSVGGVGNISDNSGTNTAANNVISSSGILQNESQNTIVLASTPEIVHAWEDVKAMFNGGTRKRLLAVHSSPSTSRSSPGLKHEIHERGTSRKNAQHGSSGSNLKRQGQTTGGMGSGSNFIPAAAVPRSSPLHFQQQQQQKVGGRQSQIIQHQQHPQNLQFSPNLNHHQFALAAAAAAAASQSSSFGGLGTNTQPEVSRPPSHTIWNPVNDNHQSKSATNSTLNDIIHAAINLPQHHQHQQHQQQQQQIHPAAAAAGISAVLANPFPWIHRNLITGPPPPPLFPFSHPFGPTSYKYFGGHEMEFGLSQSSGGGSGKTSAFKPITPTPMTPDPISPLELGRLTGSAAAPFPFPVPTSNMDYPYLSTSTSSWLGLTTSSSSTLMSPHGKKGMSSIPNTTEGLGLPEDLSLNSAGGSIHQSSSSSTSSSSPSSSIASSSYSSTTIEYKSNHPTKESRSSSKITLSPKEEHVSPQPTLFDVKSATTTTAAWGHDEHDQEQERSPHTSTSDGESSDVDITDNEEENLVKNEFTVSRNENLPPHTVDNQCKYLANYPIHISPVPTANANTTTRSSPSQRKKPRLNPN